MTTQTEAERLADELVSMWDKGYLEREDVEQAAAELRRLVSFNQKLMDEVARLKALAVSPAPTVESNSQDWRGMDGATAWHLIDRHADGWGDVGKMMGEWLAANQALAEQPAQQNGAAVMPCGAVVSNVYEAYDAGKRAAEQPAQCKPLTDEQKDAARWRYMRQKHANWPAIVDRASDIDFDGGLDEAVDEAIAAHGITKGGEPLLDLRQEAWNKHGDQEAADKALVDILSGTKGGAA